MNAYLRGVRSKFPTIQPASAVSCMSVQEPLRMRALEASPVKNLRLLPTQEKRTQWELEGWTHLSQSRICHGAGSGPFTNR